ncbi:MAG: POTRA domain-containing protein [Candidatus Pacebacteria bacterium]|nr:POTRA domain-containing protein [Candidatus Paceibacterota bacterium]
MKPVVRILKTYGLVLLWTSAMAVNLAVAADKAMPTTAFPFPYPIEALPPASTVDTGLQGFPLIAPTVIPLLSEGPEAPRELQVNRNIKSVTPESLPDIDFAPVAEALSTATVSGDTLTRLQGVTIEGNTAYSDEELQEFVRPYIGQKIEIKKIYEAARQITDKYHRDGYFLSQAIVPDQTIADGYYRIRVIEGYVSDVLIQGDVGPVESLVRNYLANIPGAIPVKISTVERYLLLSRDIPGMSITSIFRSATGASGARQMVVQLDRKPFGASVSIDNRASEYSGPGQVLGRVYSSSFTPFGEQTDFLVQNSWDAKNFNITGNQNKTDLQHFALISLSGYLNGDGLKLTLSGNYGPSKPGRELVGVYSKSVGLSATLAYPFVRSRDYNISSSLVFTANNSATNVVDFKTDTYVAVSRSYLRSLNFSLQGDVVDPWNGSSNLNISVEKGMKVFGATPSYPQPSDLVDRPGAHSDYTKVSFEASTTHILYQFAGGEFNHYGYLGGQYAYDRLYGSEQFSGGGTKCGRGYYGGRLSQIVPADHGLCTMQELQLALSTDLGLDSGPLKPVYFVFIDSAKGWERRFNSKDGNPQKIQIARPAVLSSLGFGVRTVFPGSNIQFDLDFDLPLTWQPYGPRYHPPASANEFENKRWSTFFRLAWSY